MEKVLGGQGGGRHIFESGSYHGKTLNCVHQHRKCKAHKTPVWMKDLYYLSYQWSFWVCVQNKEHSFTYY